MPDLYTLGQSMLGQNSLPAGNDSQAVRPTSGQNAYHVGNFDASYMQNLATYIGGLFQRPKSGPLQFNPLGSLTDIFGAQPMGGGNDPTMGLPQTMLQGALNMNPTFKSRLLPGTEIIPNTGSVPGQDNSQSSWQGSGPGSGAPDEPF